MINVLFHPEAEKELKQAARWYAHIAEGLGEDFVKEVRRTILKIAESPEAWPRYARTLMRKCPVSRFPYLVFYVILDECIWIVAVAHAHRRPGYWRGRAH